MMLFHDVAMIFAFFYRVLSVQHCPESESLPPYRRDLHGDEADGLKDSTHAV